MSDLQIDLGAHLPGCTPAKICGVCVIANTLRVRLGEAGYREFLDRVKEINNPDASAVNLDLTIEETIWNGLPTRARICLKNHNVRTLRDLTAMTGEELLRSPNFGRKALNEVKAALGKLGLQLAG